MNLVLGPSLLGCGKMILFWSLDKAYGDLTRSHAKDVMQRRHSDATFK